MGSFSPGFGEGRGKLNVTPKDIYEFDDVEVNSYRDINKLLSFVTNSKLDLITLLHFSELSSKSIDMFFKKAGINKLPASGDIEGAKTFVNNLQARVNHEKEEGGTLIESYAEKQLYEIDFDPYVLDFDNNKYNRSIKIVPRKEEEQKEYLSQLIDNGFFNVKDNYNKREDKLYQLFLKLSVVNAYGSYGSMYNQRYRNRTMLEAYKKNMLSDAVLQMMINIRMERILQDSYKNDIAKFAYTIRLKYPELAKKMIQCIEKFMDNPQGNHEKDLKNIDHWKIVAGRDDD